MDLGLWIELRPADDLPRIADQVAALGFAALQIHFPAGCAAAFARRVARACAESGLTLAAVSGYANPLRPDTAPMGTTVAQLAALIKLLPILDCRRLVSWSGTYAEGIGEGHPDNRRPAALEALRHHVEGLLPALDAVESELILEPFFAHVLSSAERAAAFCRAIGSPYVGLVLDAPNLLPPEHWERQAPLIAQAVAILAPYVRLIHLKDMRLLDGALEMPGPGHGLLDYPALLGAIAANQLSAPWIIEHVRREQAAAARSFVLGNVVAVLYPRSSTTNRTL
jgi:sugar phosphate isomerase/epimerase